MDNKGTVESLDKRFLSKGGVKKGFGEDETESEEVLFSSSENPSMSDSKSVRASREGSEIEWSASSLLSIR